MLVFREEKSPDDEIKAWQFWHGRQHSVKQRILDAGNIYFITQIIVIIGITASDRRTVELLYWSETQNYIQTNNKILLLHINTALDLIQKKIKS